MQQWQEVMRRNGWQVPEHAFHPLVQQTIVAMDRVYKHGLVTVTPCTQLFAGQHAVTVKREDLQRTGSFKARGAANKILSISDQQLGQGLVTSSTGNHALGCLQAWDFRRTHDNDCVEAEIAARTAAEQQGMLYLSPYNDIEVAGGQGTIALELLVQFTKTQLENCTLYVPVGGGGLMAGIAATVKAAHPQMKIVGCQPAASDVMCRSVAAGRIVDTDQDHITLSDGTAGGIEDDTCTLEPCMRFVDRWVTVNEQQIATALVELHSQHGIRCEGAAAMTWACVQQDSQQRQGTSAVMVCCGGNIAEETVQQARQMIQQ